jgi:SPP1 gp7 family putative phage head morphogenesis protein
MPDQPTEDNLAGDLIDAVNSHVIDVLRVGSSIRRQVLALLKALEIDLSAQIDKTVGNNDLNWQRLTKLLTATRATINEAYTEIEGAHTGQLATLARASVRHVVTAVNDAVKVELMAATFNKAEFQAMAKKTLLNGRYADEWWSRQAKSLQDRFTVQMRLGMLQGESISDLVKRLRGTKASNFSDGLMQMQRYQAEALVRTSVIAISNAARLQSFMQNADIIKGVQWVSTLDSRTTEICIALDGKMWTLPESGDIEDYAGYKPIGHDKNFPGPTAHFNCLLGNTLIDASHQLLGASVREYTGELVTLKTANGKSLTGTPNHPIATKRGWRNLGEIVTGDDLLCDNGRVDGLTAAINQENKHRPTLLEDITRSFLESRRVLSIEVPVTAPDFHGDGPGSEVAIIGANLDLPVKSGQIRSERIFKGRSNGGIQVALPGVRHLKFLTKRLASSSRGNMSGSYQVLALTRSRALPTQQHILMRSSDMISRIGHPPSQGSLADSELFTDLLSGDFGKIKFDRVSMVSRRKAISVRVHNLETTSGFYIANGIVCHNCRSTQIAVMESFKDLAAQAAKKRGKTLGKSRFDEFFQQALLDQGFSEEEAAGIKANTRASMDGQVGTDGGYAKWLNGKDAAFQDELLGKTAGKLWRAGKIDLTDITNTDNRPLSASELLAKVGG